MHCERSGPHHCRLSSKLGPANLEAFSGWQQCPLFDSLGNLLDEPWVTFDDPPAKNHPAGVESMN
jgi:hypothetical protein